MSHFTSKGAYYDKSKGKKDAPALSRKNIRFVHKRCKESSSKSVGIILHHHQPASTPTSSPLRPKSVPSSTRFVTVVGPTSVTHGSSPISSTPTSTPVSSTPSSIPPSTPSSTPISFTPLSTPSVSTTETVEAIEQNINLEQQGYVLGSIRLDGRLCIGVHNMEFFPSSRCSSIIHSTFEERVHPEAYKWVNLSEEIKEFYWDEFQKACYWDDAIDSSVKKTWKRKAKERYRQYIHQMSSKVKNCTRKKPTQLSLEVRTAWNVV